MLKSLLNRTKSLAEPAPDLSGLLEAQYRQMVEQELIAYDLTQFLALKQLQQLLEDLQGQSLVKPKPFATSFKKSQTCRSLYIHGPVGRGKSMLMDLFYAACSVTQKRRVHFHAFMLEVHAFIFKCQQDNHKDAIPTLAKKIRKTTLLLCFDEFNVTDIADAMILQRLFTALFDAGVVVVMTSNRHPSDVYQGGLLKEQFLFFTKLLLESADLIELAGGNDYRLSKLPSPEATYVFPLSQDASEFARLRFQQITEQTGLESTTLDVYGRKVTLSAAHKSVAMVAFNELCGEPLGAADYLAIANAFNTIIVVEIPKLTQDKRNEAKRFVTLIDALYENKVKLICTAQVPAQELYTEGDGSFEFARTVSRLIEMQSLNYLGQNVVIANEW
jgi:cell division protein ZapE